MALQIIKVGPFSELVSLDSLRDSLGFTPSGMIEFLKVYGLAPIDLAPYRGHTTPELYVSVPAYELALTAHVLPDGKEWERFRADPEALTILLGLLATVYGLTSREELRDRLHALGKKILTGTLRDMRLPSRGKKPVLKTHKGKKPRGEFNWKPRGNPWKEKIEAEEAAKVAVGEAGSDPVQCPQ